MTISIIIFAGLILLAGMFIVIKPDVMFDFLRNNSDRLELHILAIVVRLVLGVLLIFQAGVSRYPLVIEVIGWLSVVAAVFLLVIGRHNFKRLMVWALSFVNPFGRVAGVMAAVFGGFLIYAFV